jgi:hypothetical protein
MKACKRNLGRLLCCLCRRTADKYIQTIEMETSSAVRHDEESQATINTIAYLNVIDHARMSQQQSDDSLKLPKYSSAIYNYNETKESEKIPKPQIRRMSGMVSTTNTNTIRAPSDHITYDRDR